MRLLSSAVGILSVIASTLVGADPSSYAADHNHPAARDVAFTQRVNLLQDVGPIAMGYRQYRPSYENVVGVNGFSAGRLVFYAKVYRLVERERTYNYFLVDVTAQPRRRRGWADYGYASFTLATKRKNRTTYTSMSDSEPGDCKKYPLTIGIGMYSVSAETTVGNITLGNCDGHFDMSTQRTSVSKAYRIRGLNSARKITMQKWIRVRQGRTPPLFVTAFVKQERCAEFNPQTNRCLIDRSGFQSRTFAISTKP